jgi:hypothetical protein
MAHLRNRSGGARGGKDVHEATLFCPEAYDYEDDVTPEAIEQLRRQADKVLSSRRWTTIEGYVGPSKQTARVG